MLINRNKTPKVTVFKQDDVMDSYVSKNEIGDVLNDIDEAIVEHSEFINEEIGFNYKNAPRELISKIATTRSFKRQPIVDENTIIVDRIDSSIEDESVIHFDHCNDVAGIISSDNFDNELTTRFIGNDEGKIYSSISRNPMFHGSQLPRETYNPYHYMSPDSVINTFHKDNKVFTIYRGGYIKIYHTINKTVDTVNLVKNNDFKSIIQNKVFRYFTEFTMNSVVTNVSYNNDSLIAISTTDDLLIFYMDDLSFESHKKILQNRLIIDLLFIDSKLYIIFNFYNELNTNSQYCEFRIEEYNLLTEEIIPYIIEDNAYFFPNCLVSIGNSIVAYEKYSKFGLHSHNKLSFVELNAINAVTTINIGKNEDNLDYEYEIQPEGFEIGALFGNDINNFFILVRSAEDNIFNKSLINVTNKEFVSIPHQNFKLPSGIKTIYHNNYVYSLNENCDTLCIIKLFNNTVVGLKELKLNRFRNTSYNINNFSICDNMIIVSFDDNTYISYDLVTINDLVNESIFKTNSTNTLEIKINNKTIYINQSKLDIFINDKYSDSLDFTNVFNPYEFTSIVAYKWFIVDSDTINISFVTRAINYDVNPDYYTRVTMVELNHSSTPGIIVLNTYGWFENMDHPDILIEKVRFVNGVMYFPVEFGDGEGCCLITCNYNNDSIKRFTIVDPYAYTKSLYLNEECSHISIGINEIINSTTIPEVITNGIASTDNDTILLSPTEFLNVSVDAISLENVLHTYATIDSNGLFVTRLLNLNAIRQYVYKRLIAIEDKYITLDDNFIKVYDSNYNLLSCEYYERGYNDDFFSYYMVTPNIVVLYSNVSKIFIDLNNFKITKPTINTRITNKIEKDGVTVIEGSHIISIIDSVRDVNYIDILNMCNNNIPIQSIDNITLNTVDYNNGMYYITVSIFTFNNNFKGSVLIRLDSDSNVTVISLANIFEEYLCFVNSKLVTSMKDENNLYIIYYKEGFINYRIYNLISNSLVTEVLKIFTIESSRFCIGLFSKNNNIFVLDSFNKMSKFTLSNQPDMIVYYPPVSDYNAKHYVTETENGLMYLRITFIDTVGITDTIFLNTYNFDDDMNYTSYFHDTNLPDSFRDSLLNFFNHFIPIINESDSSMYLINLHEYSAGYFKVELSGITNIVINYLSFGRNIEGFKSNLFLDIFTGSFVAFDTYCGSSNKDYYLIDNILIKRKPTDIVVNYNINEYSVAKFNDYNYITSFVREDNIYKIVVTNRYRGYSKYINYLIENDTIILSEFGYIGYKNNKYIFEIIDENNFMSREVSTIHVNLNEDINIVLKKVVSSNFGFMYMDYYNEDVLIYHLDLNSYDTSFKPVFLDNTNTLISILSMNNGTTACMMNIDTYNIRNITFNMGDEEILPFSNVVDAVHINEIDNSVLLVNSIGDLLLISIGESTGYQIEKLFKISNDKIVDFVIGIDRNKYNFIRILNISDDLFCSVLVQDVNNPSLYLVIPGCRMILNYVDNNYIFEIDTTVVGVLESEKIADYNLYKVSSRYLVPTYDNINGLPFGGTVLSLDNNSSFNINVNVDIGKLNIDKDFFDIDEVHSQIFNTNIKAIRPKIFLSDRYFLVQYGDKIDIFTFVEDDRYTPNFQPLYRIIQNNQVALKEIVEAEFSFNNVILTFSDRSCRSLILSHDVDEMFIDNGFKVYDELDAKRDIDIKYFITDNESRGYITSDKIFILNDGAFEEIKIKDNNIDIKLLETCLDKLHNRIYCISEDYQHDHVLGYVDLNERKYIRLRVFNNTKVETIYSTPLDSIDIITTDGSLYCILDNNLFKIRNKGYINTTDIKSTNLIVYPYNEFKIIE